MKKRIFPKRLDLGLHIHACYEYRKSHKITILLECIFSPENSQASEPKPMPGSSIPSPLALRPLCLGQQLDL